MDGKQHVRRDRAYDDGFDFGRSQTALGQRTLGSSGSQVAGGNALVHDVPLADAGTGENPFVGGFDHFFEVGVGKKAGRDVGAEGADFRSCSSEVQAGSLD